MGKRILVTGGAGFIGSHLCEQLVLRGEEVICLDNLYTGARQNVKHLLEYSNFTLVIQDVTQSLAFDVDQIYNLACPASPVHYQRNPIKTTLTSVQGAVNVLELAMANKAKVLQASTSEVYGDPLEHPQRENYWGNVNCSGIRSCYDEGKRVAETLFADYRRYHGTQTKIIRIFNTYGPRMHPNDGRVVSNFIVQALKGEAITIYGTGEQTRSFCYVDDLVSAIICMMNKDGVAGPINLGNPNEFTVLELAQRVIQMVGGKSEIVFKDLPQDDPQKRRPDISLAKTELGWEPEIDLEQGLHRTIDYFRSALK